MQRVNAARNASTPAARHGLHPRNRSCKIPFAPLIRNRASIFIVLGFGTPLDARIQYYQYLVKASLRIQ
jgi:hypothetical protein